YGETDANSHYKRKALNGFTLTAGTRKTITIDLSSVPGAIGGLTAGSYGGCGTGPYYCPTTSYTLDPSQIRDLIFLINFGGNDINLSEGDGDYTLDTYIAGGTITPYNGVIKFYDFKIGTVSTPAALNKTVINNSLTVYPSPAKESLTVSFDANETTDVTLSDIVGNKMLSASANAGSNKITMNTSNLSSGIYILNVSTENGKVARKVVIE
ncbi:MAG: T9SS type A sorting domain-containing protein, partial [Cytophagaceae bacterium]